jgi:serine/threonine protein kinase
MFEALSGRLPFSAQSVSKLLIRIIREEAPRLSEAVEGIDPALNDLVARLLARDREDRFPSARALARALSPYIGERALAEARVASMLRLPMHMPDAASAELPTKVPVPAQRVA